MWMLIVYPVIQWDNHLRMMHVLRILLYVAVMISQEGIDIEGESSSNLSPVLWELEKSSCSKELKSKRTTELCVAAVAPELWRAKEEVLNVGKEKIQN